MGDAGNQYNIHTKSINDTGGGGMREHILNGWKRIERKDKAAVQHKQTFSKNKVGGGGL